MQTKGPSAADPATAARPAQAPHDDRDHAGGNGHGRNGVFLPGRGGLSAPIPLRHVGTLVAAGGGKGDGNGNGSGQYRDPIATAAALLRVTPALEAAGGRPGSVVTAESWGGAVEAAPQSFYLHHGKRLLDVVAATVGLVLSAPVLLLFALLIKLDSRGPVMYRSLRLGRNGKPFVFYKLRSMYVGADRDRDQLTHLNETDGPVFKLSRDPRTTRIGRLIRRTSVDELPQFFNVLRGEMSMVGPRPPLPDEVEKYESWHRRRLEVKPGITCLWQISGRSRIGFNEWMRLDLEYIKHQSFRTDLRILLRTIPAVLSREGAY